MEYKVADAERCTKENTAEIKIVKDRVDMLEKSNIRIDLMLNNILVCFGELKESINNLQGEIGLLKAKPSGYWDKVIFALIAAGVSAVMAVILKGGAG